MFRNAKEEYMKIGNLAVFAFVVLVAGLVVAGAEEKYGVKVFDGAKYDADTSQFLITQMKVDGACYRTDATPAQVNDFYKTQPGTTAVHTDATGGMFKKGNVNITVQAPWMNMKTGQRMKDTLISIVKTQ
jgi:maltose-binding protein MalE